MHIHYRNETTSRRPTYHRRERLASRAEREREARAEAGARIAHLFACEQHGALYALKHPIRDRRVHGKHEAGLEAQPEASDALLAHDLPRDAKEGLVMRLASLSLALRRPDLLAGGDDGHGDREDLREGASDGAQCKFGDGGEAGGRRACRAPRSKAFYVRRAHEGVEEEIGVFCG